MSKSPVLIVEDEMSVVDVLRVALRREGIAPIAVAYDGSSAMVAVRESEPAVVILNVVLPDMNGLDLAGELRRFSPGIPLLFLVAHDMDIDLVNVFQAGADDCVTMPFNPLEVAARIKALIRRAEAAVSPSVEYDFGRFRLFPEEGRLVVEGRDVPTPARELKLLTFLARREGLIFSAEDLYLLVWNAEPVGPSDKNTVSVHVRRLREHIERDPATPECLLTVRGLGYKLVRSKRGVANAGLDEAIPLGARR